jgi:TonB family protein
MPLKIGELAKQSKISKRTLHYYDEIGLVSPSLRSEQGHRLYSEAYIRRLQKVILLKSIAFSLDDIRKLVDSDLSPIQILDIHIELMKQELAERQNLLTNLEGISERLRSENRTSVDELIDLLEGTKMLKKNFDDPKYIDNIQKSIFDSWQPINKKGQTLVSFKINSQGQLGELKVLESSGDDDYDENCMKAVTAAADKFTKPPADDAGEQSGVEMHFAFGEKKKD